jgi:phage terminase large subunit GpA-like protein
VPWQREIMDLVNDPLVREIWVIKSAQVGWTEILLNVIGYYVDCDPSPLLCVQPTLELAETFSKDRVAPMVRDTPAITEKIADPKSRDSGNTLLHKKFAGGHLTIAGANSPSGLRARPIRILLCDEIDGYPASAGAEGDPFMLARKRTTTFWNRKILAGSTPTIKGQSRVETGYDSSDQRHFEFACYHCATFQRLVWSQVKWTELGAPAEDACYQCVHCGEYMNEAERQIILQREYRVVALKPFAGIAGLHINELMSPFVTLGEMAVSFLDAKKLPETFQVWINTSLGETWEDSANIAPEGLAKRRETYGIESIPAGVIMLTIGVDTQDDRLEWLLVGHGAGEENWVVKPGVLRGDPGVGPDRGVWQELTGIRHRQYYTEDGRLLRVQATGIDSGGHFATQVYNYAHRYRFEHVYALKGQGGQGRLIWPRKPGKTKLSKADVYSIGVDAAKDLLYGRLARISAPSAGEPKAGFIHLPADVDEEWLEQLTSETKVYHKAAGRRVAVWRPKRIGIRTEGQDTWIYAYAVMLGRTVGRGVSIDQLAAALAARAQPKLPTPAAGTSQEAPTSDTIQPPDPPPKRPPPKKRPRFRVSRSSYLKR